MARHFLNLAGAATLETESYLLAQRAVADAVEAAAMAVLHGSAGLGKTFAVEDALAAPALPLLWVSFPSRPTPRLIAATLLEELTGRSPAAVAQLLEALPHDTASLDRLLEHAPDLPDPPDDETLPLGAGPEFPYLEAGGGALAFERPRRPRTAIAYGLARGERSLVYGVWDRAHTWNRWFDEHPEATYQQSADAVYLLARHGDTASEIYVRTRAALDVFVRAGLDTDVNGVDSTFDHAFGEIRPCDFNAATARAAALADQSPDPQLAALIALAAVCRDPFLIRQANLRALHPDGGALAGPWGGVLAIPPELRRFLATHHQQLEPLANRAPAALFSGTSHGRLSQPAIRRALAALDAPASLWEDPPDTPLGEGANADGRTLLNSLTAWNLWLERRHQREAAG